MVVVGNMSAHVAVVDVDCETYEACFESTAPYLWTICIGKLLSLNIEKVLIQTKLADINKNNCLFYKR